MEIAIDPVRDLGLKDEPSVVPEVTKATQHLSKEMFHALNISEGKHQDRGKKMELLKMLSPNIVQELNGFLINDQIEDDIHKKRKGEPLRLINERAILESRLFELLVETENINLKTPAGDEVLALMHNPLVFGEEFAAEIGTGFNPDGAIIGVTPEGEITVEGFYDAKLVRRGKHLNKRACRQFSSDGFRRTLNKIALSVNSKTGLEQYGLREIARRGSKIEISPNIVQVLIVPADCDTNNLLPDDLSPQEKLKYAAMLANSKEIEVRKSIFTCDELSAMAEILYQKVLESRSKASVTTEKPAMASA